MTQINPFINSILQAPQAQRTAASEKDRQLRRANDLTKNAALAEDQLRHEVESSDALTPAQQQQPQRRSKPRRARRRRPDSRSGSAGGEQPPHLDVTA